MEIVKDSSLIQNEIERFVNKDVYIHLETTNVRMRHTLMKR